MPMGYKLCSFIFTKLSANKTKVLQTNHLARFPLQIVWILYYTHRLYWRSKSSYWLHTVFPPSCGLLTYLLTPWSGVLLEKL